MERPFIPMTGQAAVEQLVDQSAQHPVIVFKHDTSCPISRAAYGEMQQFTQDVALIDVAREYDLSQAIAERMGVAHASPQVLVLRDGQAAWSASHYDITHDAVTQALGQAKELGAE
jgi:bacillithiol system protein YtxJ